MPSPTRIAIDATVLSGHVKGAGRVVKNLLPALANLDGESTYLALATNAGARKLNSDGAKFDLAIVPTIRGVQWEMMGLNKWANKYSVDLTLTFREFVGFGGSPIVMHVFEPPGRRVPSIGSGLRRSAKDKLLHIGMKGSVRRAAAVTAGSESTADWLRANHGIDPAVIHPGIDEEFLADAPRSERVEEGSYFLHIASGDPRDNTDLVLTAFSGLDHQALILRLVGTPESLRPLIEQRVRDLGIAKQVKIEGWVSDSRLRDLYLDARALIHPSSHEGFCGYPALEALALGTPVVAVSSPGTEALTGRALLIHTPDQELLRKALVKMLNERTHWKSVAQRARTWTRTLTWEAAAGQFILLFREILGRDS